MEFTPPLKYLLRQSLKRYVSLSLITTGLIILVRLYELIFISGKSGYPTGSTFDLISGLRFDLMMSLRFSACLMIPFLLVDHFNQKAARIFYAIFAVAVVAGDLALLRYFSTTRIPLGSDILGYTFSEIQQTVQASGEMSYDSVIPFLIMISFSVYAFFKWSAKKYKPIVSILVISAISFSLLPFNTINPYPTEFKNEFRKNITANKFNLFTESILEYYDQSHISSNFELNDDVDPVKDLSVDPVNLSDLDKKLIDSDSGTALSGEKSSPLPGNPFTYLSHEFPFLHKEQTPNMLDPFFKPWSQAPSIVFIIVESLGRGYTGENAYLGSFTPFLDSLMSRSLYWENCLSTSGRTFSVLPSLMGSLPFGEKGFAAMGEKMPDHLTLLSLLKNRADYSSSFYYGGNPKFDDMETFMRRQGVARIVGEKEYGADYQKLPSSSQGFSWGYGDREIFRKYLTDLKADEKDKRVDVLLTIAMHNPFMLPNQQYYNELFEKRMTTIHLSEDQKTYNRKYREQFATILYFDDALRYFFQEFSKLKRFENTIFVLTGDHRMPEIPISTQIDRFHVPLVIYSPLLKQGCKFSSIVTHFDVAPTLLALFKERMNLSLPTVTTWIGHGMDTARSFRNLNAYPLKRNTGELRDFISGDHFLSGTTLYKISADLNIEPETNPALLERLQTKFSNFKGKNSYATDGNHLIPDSLKSYNNP